MRTTRATWLLVIAGCGSAAGPAPAATPEPPANVAGAAARCPAPPADRVEPDDAPPWERDPLGRSPGCLETDDGATVEVVPDASDHDGWRATLVVRDARGVRFSRATRSVMSMAVTRDGGVVLAHTEDYVERFARDGTLAWSTKHPSCGYAEVSVARDGRVALGCGFSIVAYAADGALQWQKWPFGNQPVGRPLFAGDTLIVRSEATVAAVDARGEIAWRIDTGDNRYVQPLGVATDGTLVFRTTMARMHTDGDVHYYYDTVPDELFAITAGGKVVSRRALACCDKRAWPAVRPWTPGFRSGRVD